MLDLIKPKVGTIQLNDEVTVNEKSMYFSTQMCLGNGTVKDIKDNNGIKVYEVLYTNGQTISYLDGDLVIFDKTAPRKTFIPTIGCDPELEIFESKWGFLPASTFLGSTSEQVGVDGCSAIAEVRPTYSDNAIKLTDNVKKTIMKLKSKCDTYFKDKSYIVRAGNGKRYPLGGHIHIGTKLNRDKLVNSFNILTLAVAKMYQKEFYKVRAKQYGKLNDHRDQPWGMEYRTLPSFIIDEKTTSGVLCAYHSLSIDVVNNFIDDNIYYKRLSKWYKNYYPTINSCYNKSDFKVINCKLKTIKKMLYETYGYKNIEGYKEKIDNLFTMIGQEESMNEEVNVIDAWKLSELETKQRIKLFNIKVDDYKLSLIKLKANSKTVDVKKLEKFFSLPVCVFGIKKSRNIDISSNNRRIYEFIKEFIKTNKLTWGAKYTEIRSKDGENGREGRERDEIGLGYNIRETSIDNVNMLLDFVMKKIKEDIK